MLHVSQPPCLPAASLGGGGGAGRLQGPIGAFLVVARVGGLFGYGLRGELTLDDGDAVTNSDGFD